MDTRCCVDCEKDGELGMNRQRNEEYLGACNWVTGER